MSKLSIELWTERGVSYAEVRGRLKERTNEDCMVATAMLVKIGLLDAQTGVHIADMADQLRDATKILSYVDERVRKEMSERAPELKPQEVEQYMELQALMVEGYVRAADACFPPQGKN